MTAIEFRMFFDALPDKLEAGKKLPTKQAFALEVQLPLVPLKAVAYGTKPLNDYTINKVLPVMRKYGFQGK